MDAVLKTERGLAVLIVILVGAAAVGGAWGFELIGGYVPCKLCLEQREPYYAAVPLAALGLAGLALRWPPRIVSLLLVLAGAAFLYSMAIGVYQAGAEWGFWTGPTDCGATRGATIPSSANDLMASLNKVRIASCTEVQLRVAGLSFAGWNVLVTGFAGALSLYAAWRTAGAPASHAALTK